MQDYIEVAVLDFTFRVDKQKFLDEHTFVLLDPIPDYIRQLLPPAIKVIERIEQPEENDKKDCFELTTNKPH